MTLGKLKIILSRWTPDDLPVYIWNRQTQQLVEPVHYSRREVTVFDTTGEPKVVTALVIEP